VPHDHEGLVGTDMNAFDAHDDPNNDQITNLRECLSSLVDDPSVSAPIS